MPALGDGHAVLKWVTSFPGNPQGPAHRHRARAALRHGDRRAPRTDGCGGRDGAADGGGGGDRGRDAVPAGAETTAVIGCGVNGAETARMFRALGATSSLGYRPCAAAFVADRLGATSRPRSRRRSRATSWSPSHPVGTPLPERLPARRPARLDDGRGRPGKAEVAVGELARADLFCDDWEQASHGGELAAGVVAGLVTRDRVTDIGRVLTGDAEGRRSAETSRCSTRPASRSRISRSRRCCRQGRSARSAAARSLSRRPRGPWMSAISPSEP